MKRLQYPFCAIVGQTEMKRALLLNAVNPAIGGVLIRGEKGTAKSTAVRALAEVLGTHRQVEGCRYGCDPDDSDCWCEECCARQDHPAVSGDIRVVELPVSATEDRVVGTLDLEYALKHGEKRFEPGILASANRNILYVDEVNLLDDHIVDVLLDSAAMGVNTVEREGVSYSHPARFLLVGTMNPEEGDLRPQLTDRFGLVADVRGEQDPVQRAEIVRRRLAFEADPAAFDARWESAQQSLRQKLLEARRTLSAVTFSDACLEAVARIGIALEVDGHRADITMLKTAVTNAALEGRSVVAKEDLLLAARLALPHRMHRQPFEDGTADLGLAEEIVNSYAEL